MAKSSKYSKRRSARKSSRKSKRRSARKTSRKSKRRSARKSSRKSKRRSARKSKRRSHRKSRSKRARKSRSRKRKSPLFRGEFKCNVKRSPTDKKEDLIKELRAYVNCVEKKTTINQDMSLQRLRGETVSQIKSHLKFYRNSY